MLLKNEYACFSFVHVQLIVIAYNRAVDFTLKRFYAKLKIALFIALLGKRFLKGR